MKTVAYDPALAVELKRKAYELGADLVGFANIERFENAPIMMSPQGILPTARTVMVCGIHHPDATIELDGEPSPHQMDSYGVQIAMNDKLDRISFRLACMLEDMGYPTVPIVSSNIWRYKQYKQLNAVFAPDVSHIYAAVAAGLTELGWNGLSMSPEYGPRNRFVTVITEAQLEPTPLYRGEKLCDMCGECIRNCQAQTFTKEVNGTNNVRIEDKDNIFVNKNLWRCAWSEHFALDLDKGLPDVVDEKAILDAVERDGRRSGTLGTCLKVCVPAPMRTEKPQYTRFTTRKNQFAPTGLPVPRKFIDQAMLTAAQFAADRFIILTAEDARSRGIDLADMMPDARAAIIVSTSFRIDGGEGLPDNNRNAIPHPYRSEGTRNLVFATLDIARMFDTLGIAAISQSIKMNRAIRKSGILEGDGGEETCCSSVIVNYDLPAMDIPLRGRPARRLRDARDIKALAAACGADLCGISDAGRVADTADAIEAFMGAERVLEATDRNNLFMPYDPEITVPGRPVLRPDDYIPGSRSVIVLGIRYPAAPVERAGKPPAEAVGPYVFVQYQTQRELSYAAMRVVRALQEQGWRAVLTHDLMNLGSETGSPRGPHSAPINNAVEAVCAGLGQLTYNRNVYTEAYGINQRFVAIVTDMPLAADAVQPARIADTCARCEKCVSACPTAAIGTPRPVTIGGVRYDVLPIDRNLCRWASYFALTNRDGFEYNGSTMDLTPPEELGEAALADALRRRDPISKFRPTIVQRCVSECPLATGERI
ncbi:MAG: hypothetical protein GX549_04940 [Clostridiales bacterium]|nr:hypothetical protein [Clostridiales bacterium]